VVVSLAVLWRLAFAAVLGVAIFVSAFARAPRHSAGTGELRRLVLCALLLYAVGWLASETGHKVLAGFVFAFGISVAAVAAWISRGRDQEDPPDDGEPIDQPPPPDPDGVPRLDWARFERDFHRWAQRPREPTGGG
jgi:hypothetical protein